MKRYFASLIAAFFAIVCFAFTEKFTPEGPECNVSTYYWLHVKTGTGLTSCTAPTIDQFDQNLDPNQNGVIDAGEIAATLQTGLFSAAPYGCPDLSTKICAVAYDISQLRVVQNTAGQWVFVPIASEVANFKCCVKRTQN